MNCQECESLFDDMIDRRVKEPTRRRMELHLSRCGICRNRLDRRKRGHRLMFQALNGTDWMLHLPEDFADRLVVECRKPAKRVFFPKLPRWALIAASLVLIAGFAFAAAVVGGGLVGRVVQNAQESAGSDEPISQEGTEATDGTEDTSDSSADASLVPSDPAVPSVSSTASTQGETTMTRKKAAAAALTAAMAAAPLAAANGDEYQFIISGDPVAAATEGSSSDSSATTALMSGPLADGSVYGSELEARYRTMDESNTCSLRSDKAGVIISIK